MMGCMDQNDIDLAAGGSCYRKTFDQEIEEADGSNTCVYLSAACMHCTDAPCIDACPAGCLGKDPETGFTVYDNTNCIGCKSCEAVCPQMLQISHAMKDFAEKLKQPAGL